MMSAKEDMARAIENRTRLEASLRDVLQDWEEKHGVKVANINPIRSSYFGPITRVVVRLTAEVKP